jgi:hypothetical protein
MEKSLVLDIKIPRTIFEDALAVVILLLLIEVQMIMNHEVVLGISQHFSLGACLWSWTRVATLQ